MNFFKSASPYDSLLSAAADNKHAVVLNLLRNWDKPGISEFRHDVLSTVLSQVNPQTNSLVYVQVAVDIIKLANSVEQLMLASDAIAAMADGSIDFVQLNRVPKMMARLTEALGRAAQLSGDYAGMCQRLVDMVGVVNAQHLAHDDGAGISGVMTAPFKTQRLGGFKGIRLTLLHIECLRQCIVARTRTLHQSVVQLVINVDFASFGQQSGERAKLYMQFRYYAGMVYAALGDKQSMEHAQRQWMLVFSMPGKFASAIQLAAYRRVLLVTATLDGSRFRLPQFFAPTHVRALETNAGTYTSIAEACSGSKSMHRVLARVEEARRTLVRDANVGLADALVNSLPGLFVRRLSAVYSSMRLGQLAQTIGFGAHPLANTTNGPDGLAQSLAVLIQNIDDGTVILEGDRPYGASTVVRFAPSFDSLSSVPGASQAGVDRATMEMRLSTALQKQVEETKQLHEKLVRLDRHLALSTEYAANSREQLTNA
ncbi:hypothetical protein H4R99_001210 [Coemansia sp. RSA 1722]|nr:hypothetical protein LPJ57_000522 [Coemansia sp. RSA 486]KAJ2601417.1 hypothetical protein GGF39_001264 [Coemansia sp. RSA 1721]KAJ2605351.1 hypothetical protein H4R99_001210 [Coemansia sp. RSA 1722]KAJ2638796.1 hypothetical protein GGF40_001394 [Coemansia sp. RSA 1286]